MMEFIPPWLQYSKVEAEKPQRQVGISVVQVSFRP